MAEDDANKVINVEKTYNQILAKREAKISRDALVERRACQLTKHFLRSREEDAEAQLEEQARQSKLLYERSMQKTKDAAEAAAAEQLMVREEKALISEHMKEMGRQRKEAEIKAKEEIAEREKWKYARVLYERFQAEDRAKHREDREQEKMNKMEEKIRQHQERIKEAKEAEDKKKQEKQAKEMAEREKAKARQQKKLEGLRQAVNTDIEKVDRKLADAKQRRDDLHQKMADSQRQHVEIIYQKVAESEEKRVKRTEDRVQKILDKVSQFEQRYRRPRMPTEEEADDKSVEGSRMDGQDGQGQKAGRLKLGMQPKLTQTQMDLQGAGAAESRQQDKEPEKKKQEDGHHPASPRISSNSKEFVEANIRAQKDYLRKYTDQQQATQVAYSRKKFKTLADDALVKQDSISDPCFVRMRALHSTYIEKKGNEPAHAKHATKQPGAAVPPRQPASARSQKEVRFCGLCEREFQLHSFVGSAKRGTLEKLKARGPGDARRLLEPLAPGSAAGGGGGSAPPGQAASTSERPAEAGAGVAGASQGGLDQKPAPGQTLYDYEVPLCASCNYKVTVGSLQSAR